MVLAVKLRLGVLDPGLVGIQPCGDSWVASHCAACRAETGLGEARRTGQLGPGRRASAGQRRKGQREAEAKGDAQDHKAGTAVHGCSLPGPAPGSTHRHDIVKANTYRAPGRVSRQWELTTTRHPDSRRPSRVRRPRLRTSAGF